MLDFLKIFKRIEYCSNVPSWRQILQLCLSLVMALLEVIFFSFFIPFLELFDKGQNLDTKESSVVSFFWRYVFDFFYIDFTLYSLAFSLVFVIVLREVVSVVSQYLSYRLIGEIEKGIQNKVVHLSVASNFLFSINVGHGKFSEFSVICSRESSKLLLSVTQVFSIFITLSSYFVMLSLTSPTVAILAVLLAIFAVLALNYTVSRARIAGEMVVDIRQNLSQQLYGVYDQLREIKVSNKIDFFRETIAESTSNLLLMTLRSLTVGIVLRSLLTALFISCSFFLIIVLRETSALDLPVLTAGLLMVMRLLPLVLNFTRVRQGFASKQPYLLALEAYFQDCEKNVENDDGHKVFNGFKENVEFKNVEFSYLANSVGVLNKINVFFKKGEATALVGGSGAGKSTLIDCIPRLLKIDRGEICFDGQSISEFTLSSLRDKIAYLPQSPKLYDGTIWYNVSLTRVLDNEKLLHKVLAEVGLGAFVSGLPMGIHTKIGDAGVKLSGGQAQRLAVARALYKRADLLIFDEPTSALDVENTAKIVQLINKLCRDKKATVLVVSHSWDVVSKLDKMVKLDSGEVVYHGKPNRSMMGFEGSNKS
ncbi:ABC transporter ATP-binding protein/permease [Alphaproteobacteria bacterium]|nr:ABC transporter ATP-binding protein/permease [Alphaproteobacteria bacterium]